MSRFRDALAAACVLAALGCGATQNASSESSRLDPRSVSSVASHMTLPPDETGRPGHYARAVVRGDAILRAFGAANGWSTQAGELSFDRVQIFATRQALWTGLLEITGLPEDTEMPGTGPVAGIEERVLVSVTEAEYARAHPEYTTAPDSFARLMAHEMIHRLHVRILDGRDDAMGPRWFYEGFAVIGSGQDYDLGHVAYESADQALAGAHDANEPRVAYRRYAAALRFFMRTHSLAILVRRAGEPGFEDWLRSS